MEFPRKPYKKRALETAERCGLSVEVRRDMKMGRGKLTRQRKHWIWIYRNAKGSQPFLIEQWIDVKLNPWAIALAILKGIEGTFSKFEIKDLLDQLDR